MPIAAERAGGACELAARERTLRNRERGLNGDTPGRENEHSALVYAALDVPDITRVMWVGNKSRATFPVKPDVRVCAAGYE